MNLHRNITRLLFALLLLVSHCAMAQEFPIHHFGVAEGLPADGVYDLLQDRSGYLWIATEGGGLVRFDGQDFENMDTPEALASANVRCLFEDHQGMIWAGTAERGVFCFDGKIWRELNQGLPDLHIRSFTEDSLGQLWAASLGGGIAILDKKARDFKIKTIRSWSALQDPLMLSAAVRCLLNDEGDVWMGSDDGLFVYRNNAIQKVKLEPELEDKVLCSFKHGKHLYFGTENGLIVRDETGTHRLHHPRIDQRRIRSIALDAHGDLWFGTSKGAVQMRINPKKELEFISELRKENGLDNDRIRKVLLDRSNTLWFGTYFGGISQLTGESLMKFSRSNNFPETYITAFEKVDDSTQFIGTFEGSIFWVRNGKAARLFQSSSKNPENPVLDFIRREEEVLALVKHDGLLRLSQKGDVQNLLPAQGEEVACFEFKEVLYLAQERKILNLKGTPVFRLGLDALWKIRGVEEHGEDLLLFCDDGIRILRGDLNGFYIFELLPKTAGKDITCSSLSPSGSLWFGSKGEGLMRWDGEKIQVFKKSSQLPDLHVHSIACDNEGNLWVSTKQGVSFLELGPDETFILSARKINAGIKGYAAAKSMSVDADDQLWMGSTNGLYCYNSKGKFKNPTAPVLHLSLPRLFFEALDQEQAIAASSKLLLDHDENHLTFDYKALDLGQKDPINYQYKLEGSGLNWQNTSDESMTFTSLPPGEYRFLLRAQNSDGIWSEEPAFFAFEISPPIYLRWWFIALVVLFIVSLVTFIVRQRIAALARQRDFLNLKVKERTAELNAAKNKSDELLLNILPQETANELKSKGKAQARKYQNASVLFSDFKGFTKMTEQISSEELVATLDTIFQRFDALCDAHGVEKIKTIGDAYMCASGIPLEQNDHADRMVAFALDMKKTMQDVNAQLKQNHLPEWNIRIGIHSGPLVAGVVGKKKFAYDIWGDTVNIAARMESSGEINRVNVSEATKQLVEGRFELQHRGKIEAKNKGALEMYFVEEKES